jgi:hypothetical protein
MFALVVFIFLIYGVSEAGAVDDYLLTLSRDPLLQVWINDSVDEKEVIASSEVGI